MKIRAGFTLVEILVILAVMGTIAGISAVGYGSWQRNLALKSVDSDLKQAQSAMKSQLNFKGSYPADLNQLESSFKASPGISLSLTTTQRGGYPVYNNLSSVQQGVLFHSICGALISEGLGKGVNNGGQTEQYISGCNVYNRPELQVNSAWTSRTFNVPIQATMLPNLVASINYTDSWRPGRTAAEKTFYQTWHDRFLQQGGIYPITTMWDPWCTGGCTWGTQLSPLPTPTGTTSVTDRTFCIQAISNRFTDITKRITPDGKIANGAC